MRQVIVIPARMSGTRLPGKPLIEIKGRPMIWRVWNQCKKVMNQKNIFIATEDIEIQNYCKDAGINCVLTESAKSAIDRIKLFSDIIPADSYLNVQGDEPIINPSDIETLIKYNLDHPSRIVFGKTDANSEEFNDYSKAKVVCDLNDKLLYSSRAGIPLDNKGSYVKAKRAIWIYAFNKNALDEYYRNSEKTILDQIEDNEILRFLEIGMDVYSIDMIGDSWAVDELKDIKIVEDIINERENI
tara:strand:- start:357 stop:1085 length:729 start_codon:yes stop_codon:yes gene_type:complete